MKILELKGYKSLNALNGFNALLLGLKMLPMHIATPYEEFYESFHEKTDAEKETMLREALAFVKLEPDEVEAIVCFACDGNNVPYGPANLKSLSMEKIFEIVIAVCMEIGKIKISIVSESEKKKFQTSALTSEPPTSNIQN